MRAYLLLVSVAAAAGGCSFDGGGLPSVGDDGGGDDDDDVLPPDGNGDPDGPDIDAAIDTAICVAECVGNGFRDCNNGEIVECTVGCDADAEEPRCLALVPSNGANPDDLEDTGALVIPTGVVVIDTDTGEIAESAPGGATYRVAGEGLAGDGDGGPLMRFTVIDNRLSVLAVDSLSIGEDAYVVPVGVRALIILSRGTVLINGTIDLGGGACANDDDTCPGPGGGVGSSVDADASGCAPGANGFAGIGDETGGGGGGYGTDGANGGTSADAPGGGGGDNVACSGATLVPLRGGGGGGAGGNAVGGEGGGGGGGLQITSLLRITIETGVAALSDAMIYAGGGRGRQGEETTGGNGSGGGGGGAGGGILLEAPEVTLSGAVIVANGGSGGDGQENGDGSDGSETTIPSPGGGAGNSRGGNGGALIAPTNGAGPTDGTGGGGGAAGRIRVNSFLPVTSLLSTISPTEVTGTVATE